MAMNWVQSPKIRQILEKTIIKIEKLGWYFMRLNVEMPQGSLINGTYPRSGDPNQLINSMDLFASIFFFILGGHFQNSNIKKKWTFMCF